MSKIHVSDETGLRTLCGKVGTERWTRTAGKRVDSEKTRAVAITNGRHYMYRLANSGQRITCMKCAVILGGPQAAKDNWITAP